MLCRRRIGRWLTDVTPLLPLLTSQQCRFHLQTAPWALTWTPSLTLRFTNTTHTPAQEDVEDPQGAEQQASRMTGTAANGKIMNTHPLMKGSTDNRTSRYVEEGVPDQELATMTQQTSSSKVATMTDSLAAELPVPADDHSHLVAQAALASSGLSHEPQHIAVQHSSAVRALSQQQPVRLVQTQGMQQSAGSNIMLMQQQQSDKEFVPVQADSVMQKASPHSIVPLFDGGDFDAEYNSKYKPVEFVVPKNTQKAVLEAVITGNALVCIAHRQ